jgi:hypothetical protein
VLRRGDFVYPHRADTDVGIVAADREQREAQLDHLRGTDAVNDSVELCLGSSLLKLFADIGGGLALDVYDVIGAVRRCDGELAWKRASRGR